MLLIYLQNSKNLRKKNLQLELEAFESSGGDSKYDLIKARWVTEFLRRGMCGNEDRSTLFFPSLNKNT